MPSFKDLSGMKFGRLTVICRGPNTGARVAWDCLCECGNSTTVSANKLQNGHTKSCGCFQKQRASEANKKHGHSSYPNGGKATKEYNTWFLMTRRCSDKAIGPERKDYFLRGIRVCDRWKNFENFLADMGYAPSPKHSIDRIDNNGHYAKENCRWANPTEQRRNQSRVTLLEFNGKTLTPMEWSKITGICNKRIHARIKIHGWSVERALTTPTSNKVSR